MESKNTIWVVEQGEYYGYRIVGIFTSQENAQKIADMFNHGPSREHATISEWSLDPEVSEITKLIASGERN